MAGFARARDGRSSCEGERNGMKLSNENAEEITEKERRESEINISTKRNRYPSSFLI
jgi:hypothetical protein